MTSAPGITKATWTHQVRLNPALPATRDEYQTFDGRVVFTVMDPSDGTLRAVADTDLAKRGEAVAYWDPTAKTQRGRGAFVYRDGSMADVVARQAQFASPVKPHVTISWATDTLDTGKVVCLPYKVKWNKGPVTVEKLPIEQAVTTVRYK